MEFPYEIETWVDPETDLPHIKVRKWNEDGTKNGVVIPIYRDDLVEVPEGSHYPRKRIG